MFAVSHAGPQAVPFGDAMAVRWNRLRPGFGHLAADGLAPWHWLARGRYDEWIEHRRRDYLFSWPQVARELDAWRSPRSLAGRRSTSALRRTLQVSHIVGRMRRIVDGDSSPGRVRA